jgi:hypothetical protein
VAEGLKKQLQVQSRTEYSDQDVPELRRSEAFFFAVKAKRKRDSAQP